MVFLFFWDEGNRRQLTEKLVEIDVDNEARKKDRTTAFELQQSDAHT